MARRALKAYVAGERDFIHEHPLSRAWWRRHPRIPEAIWCGGFPFRATTSAHGKVTLEVEGDLLERLRLGTYVGSCLGLGGSQAYSAAAVALDVNKQVVYARTAARRVIARQVLAISEDEHLVCFTVYPEGVDGEVLRLFRGYDEAMALRLGIRIHRPMPESTDPHIDLVLATDWWYDYPWDPREAATGDSRPRSGRRSSSNAVGSRGRGGPSAAG